MYDVECLLFFQTSPHTTLRQILTEMSEFSSCKVDFTGKAGERARRGIFL